MSLFPTSGIRGNVKPKPSRMALYACGFNPHGQLLPNSSGEPPQDLYTLIKIAEGDSIRVRCAFWSSTVLEIDGVLIYRGSHAFKLSVCCEIEGPPASDIKSFFGDASGVLGALTNGGVILTLHAHSKGLVLNKHPHCTFLYLRGLVVDHIAIAGNDQVCLATHKSDHTDDDRQKIASSAQVYMLHIFPDIKEFLSSSGPTYDYRIENAHTSLLASNTSFAALNTTGEVEAFGDPRHCPYGRSPVPVPSLGGIPIAKVATGGWITAALSRDKDLYVFGGRPGEEKRMKCLPMLNSGEDVSLVDLEGEVDVRDVGVGAGHVVALTEKGTVWGVGENGTGQLGMGGETVEERKERAFQEDWVRLGGDEVWGKDKVVGVEAKDWGTFVLVERRDGG